MRHLKHNWLLAMLLIGSFSSAAQADLVLDTTGASALSSVAPLTFDSNDFYAAEFSLGDGQTITSIQAYINAGNFGKSGDTFSFHLYSAGSNGLPLTDLYSVDATYQTDGWNGLNNLSVSGLAAGNYWVALETSSSNLELPSFIPTGIPPALGTTPALAYAFSSGSNYSKMTDTFGVQVTAVPLPAAAWLFGTGLFSLAFRSRRKVL